MRHAVPVVVALLLPVALYLAAGQVATLATRAAERGAELSDGEMVLFTASNFVLSWLVAILAGLVMAALALGAVISARRRG